MDNISVKEPVTGMFACWNSSGGVDINISLNALRADHLRAKVARFDGYKWGFK